MGIFQRLSLLLRSNINDAISKGENPEKVLSQVLVDMRDQLAKAKQEVAVAIADERRLAVQVEEERKLATDWEQRAVLAVREGRDDLARQALVRQQEHAERTASLEQTWQNQAGETEKLKNALRQLSDRIEEAKRKKNLLVAKQKRAQAQKRIHETMSGLSDRSAFEVFERMADKIEDTERRALAAAEVQESLTGDSLEKEFAELKGTDDVDRRLAALKARVLPPGKEGGALPPGSSAAGAPPKRLSPANVETGEVVDAELEEET